MVDFFPAETLKIHTNAHAVRGRPTPKDVERQFRNGSFHELKSQLKNSKAQKNSNETQMNSNETQMNSNETQMNSNELHEYSENTNTLVSRDLIYNYSEDVRRRNNNPKNMDAILDSFKTVFSTFAPGRSLGLAVILMISFICIILFLFTILNSFLNSLSFVQIAVPSVLMAVFCIVLVVQYFIISTTSLINSSENECNVFEGAEQLSVFIHHDKKLFLVEEHRSRYAKSLSCQYVGYKPRGVARDREPSRVPVKQLTRLLHKSRNVRKMVRKYIVKNVPRSSRIHCFVNKCNFIHEEVTCYHEIYHSKCKASTIYGSSSKMSRKLRCRKALYKKKNLRTRKAYLNHNYYQPLLTNPSLQRNNAYSPSHVYKSLNHRISHCKFTLSRDVEKNPGPSTVIDPNKTICAPYSQGNISLFGSNAGRQCVAMSLCGLLYNHRSPITSSGPGCTKVG